MTETRGDVYRRNLEALKAAGWVDLAHELAVRMTIKELGEE